MAMPMPRPGEGTIWRVSSAPGAMSRPDWEDHSEQAEQYWRDLADAERRIWELYGRPIDHFAFPSNCDRCMDWPLWAVDTHRGDATFCEFLCDSCLGMAEHGDESIYDHWDKCERLRGR
jgi:hypothetical protein